MNKEAALEKAQSRIEFLDSLIQASKVLNSTLDLQELLDIILDLAIKNTGADSGTIYLLDAETNEIWSQVAHAENELHIRLPLGEGLAGYVAQTGNTINLKNAYKDPRFNNHFDKITGYKTKTMLCMPMINENKATIGVFQLINKKPHFTATDETFLNAFAVHASIAIEKAELYRKSLEKKALDCEISLASDIQRKLLPKDLPEVKGYDIAGINLPSKVVGGDYYDFIKTRTNDLVFAIGDVAGKGVPAGFIMATLRTAIHSLVDASYKYNLTEIVEQLNALLYKSIPRSRFVTLFLGVIQPASGLVEYVNAGHTWPFYLQSSGSVQKLTTNDMALGIIEKLIVHSKKITLKRDESLLLYTDGVTEAMDERNEEYGETALMDVHCSHAHLPVSDILNKICESVFLFAGNKDQHDDVTLAMIKRI